MRSLAVPSGWSAPSWSRLASAQTSLARESASASRPGRSAARLDSAMMLRCKQALSAVRRWRTIAVALSSSAFRASLNAAFYEEPLHVRRPARPRQHHRRRSCGPIGVQVRPFTSANSLSGLNRRSRRVGRSASPPFRRGPPRFPRRFAPVRREVEIDHDRVRLACERRREPRRVVAARQNERAHGHRRRPSRARAGA